MYLSDFTTILAVDERHQHELKYAWKTWEKLKPEIIKNVILIYDSSQIDPQNNNFIDFIIKNKNVKLIPWNPPDGLYKDQREKMLTSFFAAVKEVKTKWYLKIDTDCLASDNNKEWLNIELYKDDPVFVTNSWGYSKPANVVEIHDNWGDSKLLFSGFPRLNLPYDKNSDLIKHDRIISFVYFGLSEWTKQMMTMCEKDGNFKLPFPSQDTYMWYCAARRKELFKRVKYKKFGFEHWHSFGNIKNRSLEIIK
jgi:hypothetical protein